MDPFDVAGRENNEMNRMLRFTVGLGVAPLLLIGIACGAAETPSSTWGTEIAIDDAAVTGSNANDHTTSAAVTPAGTCAGGDTLYWRYEMDATGTTTAVATLHYTQIKMEWTSNVGD